MVNRLFLLVILATACYAVNVSTESETHGGLGRFEKGFGCYFCREGTVCAGPLLKKRCVIPISVGKRCGVDPYWVCKKGLTCVNHVCTSPYVTIGKSCTNRGSICQPGTVCVGTPQGKVCMRPIGVGRFCGNNPHLVCEAGLQCIHGTCVRKVALGGNCLVHGSVCTKGTVCAGTFKRKVCVTPKPIGHRCGHDPFWVCRTGLKCVKGRCTTPGGSGKRSAGMRCGPGWKCGKGLKCQKGICRIRKKRSCVGNRDACVLGTVCAGPPHKLRCVRPMTAGERCGRDPYWVCARGLKCQRGRCRTPPGSLCKSNKMCMLGTVCIGHKRNKRCTALRKVDKFPGNGYPGQIPVGKSCLGRPSACVRGSVCAGTAHVKLCVIPKPIGQRCGHDAFWVCRTGLKCVKGRCTTPRGSGKGGAGMRCGRGWKCKKGLKCQKGICRIRKKRSCVGNRGACVLGAVCAGPPHKLRCVRPMTAGERCGRDPYWVCARGLKCQRGRCRTPPGSLCKSNKMCMLGTVCIGHKRKKRCTVPRKVDKFPGNGFPGQIPVGKSCLGRPSACVRGSVCAGTARVKLCVIPKPIGQRCGHDAFWVCRTGLKCVKGRCTAPRGSGKGGAGMRCGRGWKCKKGLECQKGICRIRKKRSCVGNRDACVLGTVCAGPPHKLRCVRPMSAGKRCGRDPYWVCERGLKCIHHICREKW